MGNRSNRQKKGKNKLIPDSISPQLSILTDKPPQGENWLHEIKFDGYRLICFVHNNQVRLKTRRSQDWTDYFPTIVKSLKNLNLGSAIFDGEVVAIDEKGQFNFQLLQNTIHDKSDAPLIYYIFDLIYYDGKDLSKVPLIERKKILRQLIPAKQNSPIQFSDFVNGDGQAVFDEACKMGLEGIMSKSINSHYIQKRTHNWLKVKCKQRQEFVVGGFTKPKGKRKNFGSLLIGVYSANGNLQYCGHVGTGFTEETLETMTKLLKKNITTKMPFVQRPPSVKEVTWVQPKLVVEVEFSAWTNDKILRMPSFKGVREDKSPRKVNLEVAEPIQKMKTKSKNSEFKFPLTNPNKILYPEQEITKLQLAEYYAAAHQWILPYITKRPLTLLRCPEGIHKECFFQKHLQNNIESLYPVKIKEKKKTEEYLYVKNIDGLMALVQLGVLEIHTWNCHVDNIEKPDMIIFDLDPAPDVEWKKVIETARFVKEELEKLNLTSFVKTTGGKGLHVVVPIKRQHGWDQVVAFSHAFVEYLVALKPQSYISVMTKSKRKGKIFIDYLRNLRGATAIAPYSTRARENAPVSTPLSWDELSMRIKSTSFTIKNLPNRLAKLNKDPWEGFFEIRQRLKLPSKD